MHDFDQVHGLDTMLRDAAGEAAGSAMMTPYDEMASVARRRHRARMMAAGTFAVVLCLVVSVATVAGVRRNAAPATQPAVPAAAPDPLRKYVTTIPVLAWGPVVGTSAASVSSGQKFTQALFAGVHTGDHDGSFWPDLRAMFPAAPIGGNAVILDQSFARSEIEQAAANIRKLPGVEYARVVDVTGLWFTVTASGPAGADKRPPPAIDLNGTPVAKGVVGGLGTGIQNGNAWARATYVGPPITVAAFDLMRRRAAEAVKVPLTGVTVKAESAT